MEKQNLFDVIPSKTAFWLGVGTAILGVGTLGFILLATCMFRGSCSVSDLSLGSNSAKPIAVNNPSPSADPNAAPAPTGTVPAVSNDDHMKGNKNAPVTLIEYSDFQCPYCGAFEPTLDTVMAKYKDQVRLVYRHFPLSFHPNALPAANAAECASEQGKFWEFHDALFANQDSENDAYYVKLATDNKLNLGKFNDCVKTQKYLKKIQDQAAAGGAAGINGTPGTFVIGKDGSATPITGAVPEATLSAAIDKALGK
ncbi:MAG: DsbA family protein [Candidatus Uhrbacteria bacterium]|nr:DsbA family protein [Candidatus Uhrbacteria bacterium]